MTTISEHIAFIETQGKTKAERYKPFLKLIERSPADTAGWRPVSPTLMNITEAYATGLGRAVEFEKLSEGGGRVRLTEFGRELLDFI